MRAGSSIRQVQGFTYLGVLFLLSLMGLALAGAGETWTLASKRARERELLWAGSQYARAIKAYYEQSPGLRQYPSRLEDLVEDGRFPSPRHHLRQLYPDPVGRGPWGVILSADGRIAGVRSLSQDKPLKQANFPSRWRDFRAVRHYSDWQFVAATAPGSPASPTGIAPAAGTPNFPFARP